MAGADHRPFAITRALFDELRERLVATAAERSARGEIDAALEARVGALCGERGGASPLADLLAGDESPFARALRSLTDDGRLVVGAALASELQPSLSNAIALATGCDGFTVRAIAALLAPGFEGAARADRLLRRAGSFGELGLIGAKGDSPFLARPLWIDDRLSGLALGDELPPAPLRLVRPAPTGANAGFSRALAEAITSPSLTAIEGSDVEAGLAALGRALPPGGGYLASPLHYLNRARAVSTLAREARLADVIVCIAGGLLDVEATRRRLLKLRELAGAVPVVLVGECCEALAPIADRRLRLDVDVEASRPPASVAATGLAAVAGPMALPAQSIDPLRRGSRAAGALQGSSEPAGELSEGLETVANQALALWRQCRPRRLAVSFVGQAARDVATRLVGLAQLQVVVLDSARLVDSDPAELERAWLDARNAAAAGCGVVVVIHRDTPRRAVIGRLVDGGLFAFACASGTRDVVSGACDHVFDLEPKSAIDDLLAIAYGARRDSSST